MKRIWLIVVFMLCILPSHGQMAAQNTLPPVVMRWAPVIYQQIKSETQENVFTEVNFDHDWRSNNNSANLGYYPPDMVAYYSLVESDNYYYIGYYFYYPRYIGSVEHDNDMNGILMAVQKNPDGFEHLDMLMAYNHKQMRKWDVAKLQLNGSRLNITISAGSHEIAMLQGKGHALPAQGVYPLSSQSTVHAVSLRDGREWYHAGYRLTSLTQLWERRQDMGKGRTFSRWGYFDSNNYLNVSAPWVWECNQINWLSEPAELMGHYEGVVSKSMIYLDNCYQSIK